MDMEEFAHSQYASDTCSKLEFHSALGRKKLSRKQLLSLEISKKFLANVPGVMHDGEQLPVPDSKTLKRLHNSQKELRAANRSTSPHKKLMFKVEKSTQKVAATSSNFGSFLNKSPKSSRLDRKYKSVRIY